MSSLKSIKDRVNGPIGSFLVNSLKIYIRRRDLFAGIQMNSAISRFFRGRSISRTTPIETFIENVSGEKLDPVMRCGILQKLGYRFVLDEENFETLWQDFSNIVLSDYYCQGEIISKLRSMDLEPVDPGSQDDFLYPFIGEGPYEYFDVRVRQGDVVIDAGANFGVFSILAAKKGGLVHSFEPQDVCFEILSRNVEINDHKGSITPWELALGEKTERVEFNYLEGRPDSGATMIKSRRGERASCLVDCISLDAWVAENRIERVDFIKADIEGAERNLLKGAKETLARFKPRLAICTYHLPDDRTVLRDLIIESNPAYKIKQIPEKIFAW